MTGEKAHRTIADHLQDAELWTQLGYETFQIQLTQHGETLSNRVFVVDFHLCSRRDNGSSLLCPPGVYPSALQLVRQNMHFTGPSRSNGRFARTISAFKVEQEQDINRLESFDAKNPVGSSFSPMDIAHHRVRVPFQSAVTPQFGSHLSAAGGDADPIQQPQRKSLLGEDVLIALLDAGLRTSMCPRSTRIAAGVKCLDERGNFRLGDIAPAVFVPNYTRKFEDQARFIPGISKFLATFLAVSRAERIESREASLELQKDLWMTVANSARNHGPVRRLRPLWSAKTTTSTGEVLKIDQATEVGTLLHHEGSRRESSPTENSGNEGITDENIFDFCRTFDTQANSLPRDIPPVALKSFNGGHSATAMDFCDGEAEAAGSRPGETVLIPSEDENSADPPGKSRSHTNSLSLSEVSMLMSLEEESRLIRRPEVTGGSSWLTQNVIRMHPLRQHAHPSHLLDKCDSGENEESFIYDQSHLVPSRQSGGVCLELDEFDCQYTKPPSADEQDRIPNFQDSYYHSASGHYIDDGSEPMSGNQNDHSSDVSLTDVLGNDHLLWHMWKRRASVAPRGEEDIDDMKTMYQTNPDMKLLSRGGDLDLSDMSSSSHDDPMLAESTDPRSPVRERPSHPGTPTSERRSYFATTRSSSSSSSYIGQPSNPSDPKLPRRGSIMKRFSWGGRHHSSEMTELDLTNLEGRIMEVKRRKTLDDYEMMERDAAHDDADEMLF
ncbi:uncharacterized protein Z518_00460 [Rhinocladiella mackenziei CBS 650.93]|uniref:Uncharacterized protein n=1 Tax=Rhinocladiella mackenziei CBS 650.93 TaxID=1442369 RepID=A0A0D2J111_9EURO|nr:uncharacterized protein Z518_00460 [Rhinocladiella mackenziei CBS 650.93]KIX09381.1 hypothetical protein Z518_00460 [Rhinocladiella mackenziei CBS 650.93]